MKSFRIRLLFLILLLFQILFSCSTSNTLEDNVDSEPQTTKIYGYIENHPLPSNFSHVIVRTNPIGSMNESLAYRELVDSAGFFQIELPHFHAQQVSFGYGYSNVELVLSPGDSLYLSLNADYFSNSKKPENTISLSGDSICVDRNKLVLRSWPKILLVSPQEIPERVDLQYIKTLLSPEIEKSDQIFLEWIQQTLHYRKALYLIGKRLAHHESGIDLDSNVVKQLSSLINRFELSRPRGGGGGRISSAYFLFLNKYREHLIGNILLEMESLEELDILQVLFQELQKYQISTITKDIIIAQQLSNFLVDGTPSYYIENLDRIPVWIESPYLGKYLELQYNKLYEVKSESNPKLVEDIELEKDVLSLDSVLLDLALNDNSDILFLTIWSTSNPLQKLGLTFQSFQQLVDLYATKVSFQYISHSSPEKIWFDMVRDYKLSGSHYRVEKEELTKSDLFNDLDLHRNVGLILNRKTGEVLYDFPLQYLSADRAKELLTETIDRTNNQKSGIQNSYSPNDLIRLN